MMTDIQENKIREIADKWGINLTGIVPPHDDNVRILHEKRNIPLDVLYIRRFNFLIEESITDFLNRNGIMASRRYDLVRLIELLSKSLEKKQTKITISTKINGQNLSINITDYETIDHLWRSANIILDCMQDGEYKHLPKYDDEYEGEYERLFDWYKDKECYDVDVPKMYWGNIMPFTTSELEEIINYEMKSLEKIANNSSKRISNILSRLIDFYKENGIFDNTTKTFKTNEGCFLYDCLAELEVISNDLSYNNQEKYQYIKRYYKEVK